MSKTLVITDNSLIIKDKSGLFSCPAEAINVQQNLILIVMQPIEIKRKYNVYLFLITSKFDLMTRSCHTVDLNQLQEAFKWEQ